MRRLRRTRRPVLLVAGLTVGPQSSSPPVLQSSSPPSCCRTDCRTSVLQSSSPPVHLVSGLAGGGPKDLGQAGGQAGQGHHSRTSRGGQWCWCWCWLVVMRGGPLIGQHRSHYLFPGLSQCNGQSPPTSPPK